jgi:hypothetical protein
VSEDDLPLFERAQEVAGDNLSSAAVRALRRFIEVEDARKGGLDEITVLVGGPGGRGLVATAWTYSAPSNLRATAQLWLGLLCQCYEVRSVLSLHQPQLAACGQALQRIRADRLQQREAELILAYSKATFLASLIPSCHCRCTP